MRKDELKLVVLENARDLGIKVNEHLKRLNHTDNDYIVPIDNSRFSNGEGKIKLNGTVREKDLFILSDVGNYGITYKMHDMEVPMSPDEHFQDIKRVISATGGHASRINVIMPLLYQARQHKRKGRESLDCAIALQELETMGVSNIITCDAHDPNVSNAIPKLPFENFYPTHIILNRFIEHEKDSLHNLLVISPDMGAMERARYYAEMLGCDVGVFYKRRDLSKVVNGKNPIVEHVYMGVDVKDKNILVVDDMIASGQSMIEVAREVKEKGAKSVYLIATFSLLTEGPSKFIDAYNNGYFNKLYSTNVSYVPDIIKNSTWYEDVDCSLYIAKIINALNGRESLSTLHDDSLEVLRKIRSIIK